MYISPSATIHPRQRTVGFLESYTHGGITTAITASEVHTPGRPGEVEGVRALAVAALKCFQSFRPEGMRIYAGSVILKPGLTDADFEELVRKRVWLSKAGFGAFADPFEYAPIVKMAKRHGMITTMHTGGSSIPGSSGIWADHVLAADPDVSFHVNGGPVAMPDEDFPKLVEECKGQPRSTATCNRHSNWQRNYASRHALSIDLPFFFGRHGT